MNAITIGKKAASRPKKLNVKKLSNLKNNNNITFEFSRSYFFHKKIITIDRVQ